MKITVNTPTLIALAVGVLFSIGSMTVQADINDGLIGAWTFDDGKVTDSIGQNHGELFKGAKIVNKGKFGKALDVDGSADTRVEIEVKDLDKFFEEAFTFSVWLFVRNGVDHSAVVWKGEKIGWGANFTFRLATTSNTSVTWGTTQGGEECWFATENTIEPGKWFNLVQTVDGKEAIGYITEEGGKTEIPISGQANPRICAAPYNLFPDRPIELGAGRAVGGNVGNDAFLDGMIDDLFIWDRALSEEEVEALGAEERPEKALSVKAHGKLATTWGKVKSYNRMR